MEVQERSFQETMAQMGKKMKKEMEIQLRELQSMLKHMKKVSLGGVWEKPKGQSPSSS